MEQPKGADDRQGTLTIEARLGWLAGIVDGEGTITALVTDRSGSRRNTFQVSPRLMIVNTNAALLDAAEAILRERGLPCYRYTSRPTALTRHECFQLVVLGWKRVARVLEVLQPYLVAKRPQADMLLGLCRSRLERGSKPGRNVPYSIRELELLDAVRSANGTPQRLYARQAYA